MAPSSYYTTTAGGGYGGMGGTSFASPQIAGLASLIIGLNPTLKPTQVRQYIINGCKDLGPPGYDAETGYGFMDGGKTLQLVLADMGGSGSTTEVEGIVNNKYTVEVTAGVSYIKNMPEETTINAIKQNLNLPQYYVVEIKNIDGVILTNTQYAGTGSVVTIKNQAGTLMKEYKIVVKGDITGEGQVNLFDIVRLVNCVFNEEPSFTWNESVKRAGKVTDSLGEPNLFDIIKLISYCFDGTAW